MKRILFHLLLLATLAVPGCSRAETECPESPERPYASVPVRFTLGTVCPADSAGTRSAADIDDDDIRQAALFVFESSSGKICLDASGRPFTTVRNSRSFDWELPCHPDGTPLAADIYVICNFGSLSLPLSDKNLKSTTLDALTYSISGIGELEKGMPMAGINRVSLTPSVRTLNLNVKKLFACFYFEFDTSELESAGLTLEALHLTTHQVNTKVHWFAVGDKAGATTTLDYASEKDLKDLAGGGSSCVYVLENMQGTIPGATSWKTVQNDLGTKVLHCTYADIGIKVLDADGLYGNRSFQVYLGDGDMVSDFDIPRNLLKTVRVRIPAENPDFVWDLKQVTLEPGKNMEVGYRTTLPLSALRFRTSGDLCTVRSSTLGTAVISVSDKARDGEEYIVEGGSANCSATLKVIVRKPGVLTCNWTEKVSYVGYRSSFKVEGLQKDEVPVEVSCSGTRSRASLDGSTVLFIPGSRWSEVVTVRTSLGRTLPVSTPGAVLPGLVTEKSLLLSIDGTPAYPKIRYVDPSTGKILDGFDPDFFNDYLRVTRSAVRTEGGSPDGLVRAACDGNRMSVFTYHIEGFVSGKKVATVSFLPIDFEEISTEIDVYIASPGISPEGLGELHDYSLIPPTGERAEDEREILSVETVWNPASLSVDPSSIVYPPEPEGVSMEWTRGETVRLTLRSDGNPGEGSVRIRIRNRNSGETVPFTLFTVEKHLHLAIGGVRSSARRLGESDGIYGSRKGASHTYILCAADFASASNGSEARRYEDWPEAARQMIPWFHAGGKLASRVTLPGRSGVLSTSGGYTSLYLTTGGINGGSAPKGTGIQLYAIHCFDGADPCDLPARHSFSGYESGRIHVHDYGDLYPASKGWLPEGASGFSGWTD